LWIEVEVSLERFLFLLRVGFVFPAARTPIRACDRSRSSNLINAISPEEELGAAQSNPTSESFSAQVRRRTRPTFQSVKKLFPSNN
jgi:hypothetical protein